MARLYADENFPLPVVEELRRLGHDVLTAAEAAKANLLIPDEAVLRFASSENRARKHFIRLHGQMPTHAGIIVCTFDAKFSDQAKRIHTALSSMTDTAQQLIRVNRPTD